MNRIIFLFFFFVFSPLSLAAGDTPSSLQPNRGGFEVHFLPANHPGLQPIGDRIKSTKVFQGQADFLNSLFHLPRAIRIQFEEVGEPGFDAKTLTLHFSYEYFHRASRFIARTPDGKGLDGDALLDLALYRVGQWQFFLQASRALVHELQLPAPNGPDEAAIDLATVLLCEFTEFGGEEILGAAEILAVPGNQLGRSIGGEIFGGIADSSRVRNPVCWVLGSNPGKFQFLVKDKGLPAKWAEFAIREYPAMANELIRLLTPHFKPGVLEQYPGATRPGQHPAQD